MTLLPLNQLQLIGLIAGPEGEKEIRTSTSSGYDLLIDS